jgi:hypothetical protein
MDGTRAHRMMGWTTFAAFVGTGVYLRLILAPPESGNAWLHYAFRANHIYLLMSGLVNLALGMAPRKPRRVVLARIGSGLVLAAPAVLLAAFAREPGSGDLSRPLTRIGVIMVAVGVILCAAAGRARTQPT